MIRIDPVPGLPEVRPGDDLAGLLADAIGRAGIAVAAGDVVVVTQKVVSKAEGRIIRLAEVEPSARARDLAARLKKDPRKVEVILRESRRVVAAWRPPGRLEGVLVVEHRLGLVLANAGLDESNVAPGEATLLPEDPDASAERLRAGLAARLGASPGVLITDTLGRPWRLGLVDVAIGVAGIPALIDLRGTSDAAGRPLMATALAVADAIAATAGLTMGKAAGIPAAVVRGLETVLAGLARGGETIAPGTARDLVRRAAENAFPTGINPGPGRGSGRGRAFRSRGGGSRRRA